MGQVKARGSVRVQVLGCSPLMTDAIAHVLQKCPKIMIVSDNADVVVTSGAVAGPHGARIVRIGRHARAVDLARAIVGDDRQPRSRRRPGALTEREAEVLGLLRSGMRGPAVAVSLGISPNTVRSHVQRIRSKLGVRSQLEAVAATRQR
jgi:DNA-binding CsgD family transcriptional regulator